LPQQFIDVDRDKVIKQGVPGQRCYKTIQAFMGGLFINYFNRFGRQWQVYIEAEGAIEPGQRMSANFCTEQQEPDGPLSSLTRFESRQGRSLRCASTSTAPRRSTVLLSRVTSAGQAMAALEEVFAQTIASGDGLRLPRHVFSGEEGASRAYRQEWVFGFSLLFVFLIWRRCTKAGRSFQRFAEYADCGFLGRLRFCGYVAPFFAFLPSYMVQI